MEHSLKNKQKQKTHKKELHKVLRRAKSLSLLRRQGCSLLRDMTFVNLVKQVILDLKKQYAVPVYDRNNIHKIDEEELVLTINDQLIF